MGKCIDHSHTDVIVINVLHIFCELKKVGENRQLTEYEFSPRSAEPTAKILGE